MFYEREREERMKYKARPAQVWRTSPKSGGNTAVPGVEPLEDRLASKTLTQRLAEAGSAAQPPIKHAVQGPPPRRAATGGATQEQSAPHVDLDAQDLGEPEIDRKHTVTTAREEPDELRVETQGQLDAAAPEPDNVPQPQLPEVRPAQGVERTQRALTALSTMANRSKLALEKAGVALAGTSFMKAALKGAEVLKAVFDLALATTATVATLTYAAPVMRMAAKNLKQTLGLSKPSSAAAAAVVRHAAAPVDPGKLTPPEARAVKALKDAREQMELASKQAKVDLARASFMRRLFWVGVAGVNTGLAVAATVATGGLAVPALVLATIQLRQAVANAHCALVHKRLVEAGDEGLPMRANALGNALFRYFKAKDPDLSADELRWKATKVSSAVSLLVTATSIMLGAVVKVAVPLLQKGIRLGCNAMQRVVLPTTEWKRSKDLKDTQADIEKNKTHTAVSALRGFLSEYYKLREDLGAESDGFFMGNAVGTALAEELRRWPLDSAEGQALLERLDRDFWVAPVVASRPDPESVKLKDKTEALADGTSYFTAWAWGTDWLRNVVPLVQVAVA